MSDKDRGAAFPWKCFHCNEEFFDSEKFSCHMNFGGLPRCEIKRIAANVYADGIIAEQEKGGMRSQ